MVHERKRQPSNDSYTSKLLGGGVDRILKKVVEEAGEVAIAGKGGKKDEIVYETADLLVPYPGSARISRYHAPRDLSGVGDPIRKVGLEKRNHQMSECLFCKIVARTIPAALVYEDELVVAFDDINPQAPVHSLVIPRTHFTSMAELQDADVTLLGRLLLAVTRSHDRRGLPIPDTASSSIPVPMVARACFIFIFMSWAGATWAGLLVSAVSPR